jgi:hypothetical protein
MQHPELFKRYFVLGDDPNDPIIIEFDNEKNAKDCAGATGLVVVPLHEVKEQE